MKPIALKIVRFFLKFMIIMCGLHAIVGLIFVIFISEVPVSKQWPFFLGSIAIYGVCFGFLRFMLYIFSESK